MGEDRSSFIKTVTLRDKDPKVTRSFEERLALLEREMGDVLSAIVFLEGVFLWRGIIATKAPVFSEWLRETLRRDVLLAFAKLFESRRKTHEIKNFTTFTAFLEDHAERIFYRTYFRLGGSGEASGEESIPTPSLDELFLAVEGFWDKHGELVKDILAHRDKSLVHLTSGSQDGDFSLSALRDLLFDAAAVLDGCAYKYDLGAFTLPKPKPSDFFRLLP